MEIIEHTHIKEGQNFIINILLITTTTTTADNSNLWTLKECNRKDKIDDHQPTQLMYAAASLKNRSGREDECL